MCYTFVYVFLFKQKTAYEMRISDWSSDVCSSDLADPGNDHRPGFDAAHPVDAFLELRIADHVLEREFAGAARVTRDLDGPRIEIGRASCRERVCQYV